MDDGIVQFLFVVILMFASLLDVATRKKRKGRGHTPELPPEEEAPRQERRPPRESRAPGEARKPARPTAEPTQGRGAAPGPRETSDSMVPEDLWKILTGELPPTREPRPREPEAEPWSEEEDRWTGEGVPYPREGESTEAETWRAEVTAEELPTVEGPAEVLPEDERRRPSLPSPRARVPSEIRPAGLPGLPTRTVAGIPARPVTVHVATSAPLALHTGPRSPAARYADLLRTGGVESLRTAVVLREVLDSPVALRGFR